MTAFSWAPYTSRFYAGQVEGREAVEIRRLAEAIRLVLIPQKVGDVGCGKGAFLAEFREAGVQVWGTDGEPARKSGLLLTPAEFLEQDFRDGLLLPRDLDVVLCLEVVEHLPDDIGRQVVRALCRSSARHIVFSGAVPGQGGTGHINERPIAYWAHQFADRGRVYDSESTDRILSTWVRLVGPVEVCTWYRDNLRVFR